MRKPMLSESIRQQCLVDELQLGQRLNRAVHQGHNADFALWLAMLSPDVQDQAWVQDPGNDDESAIDWRRRFQLPAAQALEMEAGAPARAVALGSQLHAGGMAAVRLQQCMQPDPLTRRQFVLEAEVWDNLAPLVQEKHHWLQQNARLERKVPASQPHELLEAMAGVETMPELKVLYFYHC